MAGGKAGYRVSLPSESSVILRNNRAVCTYELLGTEVRRRTAEMLTLTISVRLTNAGPLDTSFGTSSFRLLVDGVPREPTNWLNTAVDARSAKDAQIEFDLPTSTKTLELQITNEETGSIPLALQRLS
ncbi:hypothetical protein D7X12_29745 [Corallococcus sicarius]|uniref:DUF4352 domain-containing protein n=1 Tax=Corallococcus sicarius TaxID=2316726 RepID=A0A3A8N8C1_9BACT|nr:hypothetical protein D7X12_29745 [Corallococcus sicarius]